MESAQIRGGAGFFRRSRQPFQILETAGDVPAFFPSRTGVSECSECHVVVVERGHTLATHSAKKGGTFHALDDGELQSILDKLRKDGVREGAWSISRFKGLGEMNAEQLWETTLNPDTRRLLPVQLGTLDFAQTESLITQLMGKGEAAARRELMELHGDDIEIDV